MRRQLDRARKFWHTDTHTLPLDGSLLAALFKLTPTELRVAVLLAQGLDAVEIARALQVQPNTVRSHIKQLLTKSDTRRQAEFVARIWRTAVRLGTATEAGSADECAPPSRHPASAGVAVPSALHPTQLGKDSLPPAPETPRRDCVCEAPPDARP